MNPLSLLISEEKIKKKLVQIGEQLDRDYHNETVVLVMVMKGAICLTADLIRNVHFQICLEYVSASSYGAKGTERGALILTGLDEIDVTNKHVLVVDDIFHSGATLSHIMSRFHRRHPKSLKSIVLLLKDVPREISYRPDYFLFEVNDNFVVGYGMDFNEMYRGLPGVYIL